MEINKIDYEIGIYDLEGHFIDSTDSWEYLKKEFELEYENIKSYLRKNSNSINSIYQLKIVFKNKHRGFPNTIGTINSKNSGRIKKPVAKYYKDKLISVYSDLNKAEELTGISLGNIASSCINNYKAKGFNFKYIE